MNPDREHRAGSRGPLLGAVLESRQVPVRDAEVVHEVAPKIPFSGQVSKLKDAAVGAAKDPIGTSGRLVEQAKGAASMGRDLAGGVLSQVRGQVASRTQGRRAADARLSLPRSRAGSAEAAGPHYRAPRWD